MSTLKPTVPFFLSASNVDKTMIIDHAQSQRQKIPNVETVKGITQPIIKHVQPIKKSKKPNYRENSSITTENQSVIPPRKERRSHKLNTMTCQTCRTWDKAMLRQSGELAKKKEQQRTQSNY